MKYAPALALAAALLVAATAAARDPEEGKPAPAFDLPATSIGTVLDRKSVV